MRIIIRGTTCRNKRGFAVRAYEAGRKCADIFVFHLSTAYAIKAAYKAGREQDWKYFDGLIREDAA